MWQVFMAHLGKNVEHLAFKSMVRTYHPDSGREVSEVGSVS